MPDLYGGETLAEYTHTDAVGHDLAVSAERDTDQPPHVALGVFNTVCRHAADGSCSLDPDLRLTPVQARDLAASLLLAADHAGGAL